MEKSAAPRSTIADPGTRTQPSKNALPHERRVTTRSEGHRTHHPIKRLIEAVNPSVEKRLHRVFRATVKEVDKHLAKLLIAIASGRPGSETEAMCEVVKIHAALAPLKKGNHLNSRKWHEQFAERLAHGECALKHLASDRLQSLASHLSKFSLVIQNDALKQLSYSIQAEQLRRELEDIDLGTTAPQAGKVSIRVLPGKKLDALHELAEELLQKAPVRKDPKSADTEIPGTLFTPTQLQATVSAFASARTLRDAAKLTVEDLTATEAQRPISKRPITQVAKLKEAVDHMVNIRGSTPGTALTGLQKKLDARMRGYERRIETLLKGPVDAFDARQWSLGDLSKLKKKLAELKSRLPSTVAVEQAIQADIDRRKIKAQNGFDHALRAALHSKDATAAFETLSASVNLLDEAEVLYEELGQPLDPKAFDAGVRQTFGQTGTIELKNLQAHLGGDVGARLQDFLDQVNGLANLGPVASGYLSTLGRILDEMLPTVFVPAQQKTATRNRASATSDAQEDSPRAVARRLQTASLHSSIATARADIQTVSENGVGNLGPHDKHALLTAITIVLELSQDRQELKDLQQVINALGSSGLDPRLVQEFSDLTELAVRKVSTT